MRALLAMACAAGVVAVPAVAQDTGLRATGGCASVPLLRGAIPVVEVTIGGKGPYRFAIDTGAPGHGRISAALAVELGLPRIGETTTGAIYGAPEVSVGAVSFKNLDLAALPTLRGPGELWDGVLGNALLELLPLTLDYGSARARFGGPGLEEGLRIRFDDGVPVLPVTVAGRQFQVQFDSGNSTAALFLDEAAARALPLAGEPVGRGGSGILAAMEAPLAVPVIIGSARLPVAAVGWPSPRAGGGLLGSRGVAGMAVTLDTDSQLARVETSGAPPRCDGALTPREPLPPAQRSRPAIEITGSVSGVPNR